MSAHCRGAVNPAAGTRKNPEKWLTTKSIRAKSMPEYSLTQEIVLIPLCALFTALPEPRSPEWTPR